MAELSNEQLEQIEEFAYLYMAKDEILIIVGAEGADLEDEDTPAGIAFKRGRLKRKAQFNKNVTRLSDQLSSPAQAIELKLAEATFLNDKKR